jgi:hypothetical protein
MGVLSGRYFKSKFLAFMSAPDPPGDSLALAVLSV